MPLCQKKSIQIERALKAQRDQFILMINMYVDVIDIAKILKAKREGINVTRAAVDLHWDLLQVKGAIASSFNVSNFRYNG